MALNASPNGRAIRIAVTSGKGGVGKTSVSVNLAVALARLGHRVGLFDADFALGNVDVCLGLTPEQHVGQVLAGTHSIADVMIDGPAGIRVIPAASGARSLTTLDVASWTRLTGAVTDAGKSLDFIIFDTATGISDTVLDIIGLADYVVVLTTFEPASVVDAYAVIKLITLIAPEKPIGVVANSVRDHEEGELVFRQISTASERFLQRRVTFDGCVPHDTALRDSLLGQIPVLESDASGPASRSLRQIASRLAMLRPSATSPWSTAQAGWEAPCV